MGHVKVYSCNCGLPLFLNNNVEHVYLDFGSKTVETNHSITYNDNIESHIDQIFPACTCYGDEFICLDTPKGNRPMYKDCLRIKELILKGQSKADKDERRKDTIKKGQVECKRHEMIEFPSLPRSPNKKAKGV